MFFIEKTIMRSADEQSKVSGIQEE